MHFIFQRNVENTNLKKNPWLLKQNLVRKRKRSKQTNKKIASKKDDRTGSHPFPYSSLACVPFIPDLCL